MYISHIENFFLVDHNHQEYSSRLLLSTYNSMRRANQHSRPLVTIIIVLMYEIPNRTLQLLNPIKINNRNWIFNGRAKRRYLTLLSKLLLSVSLSNSLLLVPPSKLCSRAFLIFSASEVFVSAS